MSRRPPSRRSRRGSWPLLLIMTGLLEVGAVACSPIGSGPGTSGAGGSRPPARTVVPGEGSSAPSAVPPAMLEPLLDDAATRTGVARDAITVVEAEATTWPNGALGCPSPGVAYTQALVVG